MNSSARRFLVFSSLVAVVGLVGFAGCATAPQAALADWQGIELKASRIIADGVGVTLPAGQPLTLLLGPDGKVSGRAAVNRYFGAFSTGPDGAIFWQGAMGSTRMAGPPEAMKLESEYLKTLAATTTLKVGRDTLSFASADGKNFVEFVRP